MLVKRIEGILMAGEEDKKSDLAVNMSEMIPMVNTQGL